MLVVLRKTSLKYVILSYGDRLVPSFLKAQLLCCASNCRILKLLALSHHLDVIWHDIKPAWAKHHYWYYQLKATSAIFPKTNSKNEYSRFQHLGKAGSQAHIDGVLAVVRRVQIDELTKAIDGLNESWSDLYSNEETCGHRVE